MGTQGDVLGARILAFIVDAIITTVAMFVVLIVLGLVGVGSGSDVLGALFGLATIPIVFLIQFGYFIYFEGNSGQTPGKRLMGIVVVTEDGGDVDYGTATIRNLLRIVDSLGIFIPYLVGLVLIFVSDDSQRLGDIVGNTLVVRTE